MSTLVHPDIWTTTANRITFVVDFNLDCKDNNDNNDINRLYYPPSHGNKL